MPKSFSQISDLLLHVQTLVDPDGDLQPPELTAIAYAISALPAGSYVLYDGEQDQLPNWLQALPEEQILDWSGMADRSFGYGGVSRVATRSGVGLSVWLGGSSLQSATGFTILPKSSVWLLGE